MALIENLGGILLFMLFLAVNFVPSILAFSRQHPRRFAILAFNWLIPVAGWVIAMALLFAPGRSAPASQDFANLELSTCQACGREFDPRDYRAEVVSWRCSSCGAELRGPTRSPTVV